MRNLSILLAVFCILPLQSQAQTIPGLVASNRLEYRQQSENHEDNFDNWLDTDVWFGMTRVGFRLELHQQNPQTSRESLTQRYLEYRGDALRLRVGNFYEKIGQGFLFQSFELQTLVLDRIERPLVLDRNADGLWVEYNNGALEARLFSGRSLNPFTASREDLIRGADMNIWLTSRLKIGGSVARWWGQVPQSPVTTLSTTRAEWIFGPLAGGFEYAWQSSPSGTVTDRKAGYGYINLSARNVSCSFEWKDYRNFHLPFNNPPTLVPTHPVTLLNRHTHLVNSDDERGYQFQLTYTPSEPWLLVFNANGGSDHQASEVSKYGELFLDLRYEVLGSWAARFVTDRAFDHQFNQDDRRTLALELERYFPGGWSLFLDLQAQKIRPTIGESYSNYLAGFSVARSPSLTLSMQIDRSTNRLEQHQWLPALIGSYVLNERHHLTLTIGGRRAGLLCSGGVCVLVPEFRGVEMRLTSRI